MFQGLLKPVLDYLSSTFFVHGFVAAFIVAKRQYSFTSYFQSLQHGAKHVYFCLTCLKTFLINMHVLNFFDLSLYCDVTWI